ncbi:MAG TPA: hypothetical protein VF733_01920 [Candidatus Saccharimonadales bacterium]
MISPDYPNFSRPTRRFGRFQPGAKAEIRDTHFIIHDGIGKDAEVHFTGPVTVATIGEGIGRGAKVVVHSPIAYIAICGSLRRDSSFRMNDGTLDIQGGIRRRAELITNGEYNVRGRISKLARISTGNAIEIVDDVTSIQEVETSIDHPQRTTDLPPEVEAFFAPGGPGIIPGGLCEIFFHDRVSGDK